MTGDLRLITKIEYVASQLERDQLIAAYHSLDEIVRELELAARDVLRIPAPRQGSAERVPVAAAG